MERMAFGLCIAPKFMDVIIKWVVRKFPDVENYVDDLLVPTHLVEEVAAELARYGLPTKPAEELPTARVLELQLFQTAGGEVNWRRRETDLSVQNGATRHEVFKWCGKLVSHYPVCGWLRPACSYLKRLASSSADWDEPVDASVLQLC